LSGEKQTYGKLRNSVCDSVRKRRIAFCLFSATNRLARFYHLGVFNRQPGSRAVDADVAKKQHKVCLRIEFDLHIQHPKVAF
jgi:hypothetical protein